MLWYLIKNFLHIIFYKTAKFYVLNKSRSILLVPPKCSSIFDDGITQSRDLEKSRRWKNPRVDTRPENQTIFSKVTKFPGDKYYTL